MPRQDRLSEKLSDHLLEQQALHARRAEELEHARQRVRREAQDLCRALNRIVREQVEHRDAAAACRDMQLALRDRVAS